MRKGRRGTPPAAIVAAVVAIAWVSLADSVALGQDALICRKRDHQAGPGSKTHRLGGGDDLFNGGPGPDVIYGGPGDDIVNGGRGNDEVHGGPGNDIVCGGVGRDHADGDAGDDEVYGEEGDDTARGGPGDDYLAGQAGKDKLLGFGFADGKPVPDGRDLMEGSYRPDVIITGGFDIGFGGDDSDVLRAAAPGSVNLLDGGIGADRIFGSYGDDANLIGDTGDDKIFGRGGNDRLFGGGSDDLLVGGDGDDGLFGDTGRDQLIGLAGTDYCSGARERATFESCEQSVDTPTDREDGRARLETALSALGEASGGGREPTVNDLQREIDALPEGSPRIVLDVVFASNRDERELAMRTIREIGDSHPTYLVIPDRGARRTGETPIGKEAFFVTLAGGYCARLGSTEEFRNQCPP